MLRALLTSVAMLVLCLGLVVAQDKDKGGKGKRKGRHQRATITNVDAQKGTITVRMKNREGKETEKTFKLTEDIRYLDSTGKVVAIDVFRSGNQVLVIEEEGRLREVKQPPAGGKKGKGNKGKGEKDKKSENKEGGGSK